MKALRITIFTSVTSLVVASLGATPASGQRRQAQEENRAGLEDHGNESWADARAHFERAVELDPEMHIARFNAACAANRMGDAAGAMEHVRAYLRDVPGGGARALTDPDLESLWATEANMTELRRAIRPAGSKVRPLFFTRRDDPSLWMTGEDGLDTRSLGPAGAVTDHSADGSRIVVPTEAGVTSILLSSGERTVLGRGSVVAVRDDVVYLDRAGEDESSLVRVPIGGGASESFGSVPEGLSVHCVAPVPDGGVLVLEQGEVTQYGATGLGLARYDGVSRTEIFPPRQHAASNMLRGGCEVSDDGQWLLFPEFRVPMNDLAATPERRRDLPPAPSPTSVAGRTYTTFQDFATLIVDDTTGIDVDDVYERRPRWAFGAFNYVTDSDGEETWVMGWAPTQVGYRAGSTEVKFRRGGLSDYGPVLSEQQDRVAFTRVYDDPLRTFVMVADPDGDDVRKVTPGRYPDWGPVAFEIAEAGGPMFPEPPPAPETAEETPDDEAPAEESAPAASETTAEESNCGCLATGHRTSRKGAAAAFASVLLLAWRRRRRPCVGTRRP